ncbi:Xylose operon regulatory protein [Posidoniimonas corsicana]|uniref:Xylose operon regulatory protein n=1 Tax=Posidoniimonas corsicana TaxID=1938618 RepID=A0A5C5VDB9_9BACT|nr:xylose operon transcription regulator XylR [Posidoniimonas corsicana]TWT35635.1 Xylose operon regulatory protein [Posidoniimonas corsicana]
MAIPEVGVLIESDTAWGRDLLRGVASYADKFGPWNLLIEPHHSPATRTIPPAWRADGLIARISTPLQFQRLVSQGAPVVDVGDFYTEADETDSVITDFRAWAESAVDHFRSKGFESFAYFAPPSRDYSRRRGKAFAAVLEQQGLGCAQYRPGYRVGRQISPEEYRRRVTRWLTQLETPVAVLTSDAVQGKSLIEVGIQAGLSIPDDVAVLAGDSDDLLCEICTPPLSSIEVASHRIGFEAAKRLAAMLRGAPASAEPALIEPLRIYSRQSTDVLAIDDPMIVRALRFMQQNACRGIGVAEVLEAVPVTRRQLERLFKTKLGRLPAEELRRLRLERGRQLLVETELSIDQVAEAAGYAGATQFGTAFRNRYGATPLQFRRGAQPDGQGGVANGGNNIADNFDR